MRNEAEQRGNIQARDASCDARSQSSEGFPYPRLTAVSAARPHKRAGKKLWRPNRSLDPPITDQTDAAHRVSDVSTECLAGELVIGVDRRAAIPSSSSLSNKA